MKTNSYNPSPLEVELAEILIELKDEINKRLKMTQIVDLKNSLEKDNPTVRYFLKDDDGDEHEMVLKIIQKPDAY